ncbi:MAG: GGDEF domain-containing protein, partial [Acidimicrobiia bacterium]|nr:GGDEF domain-containing protein [Acidimicrobiia bacterium]
PAVRPLIERLGITHSAYVPVVVDGEVDGVLSVSIRGGAVPAALFDQCKALAHLTELALGNALAHRRLAEQALTDPLTGLLNRRGFEQLMDNRPGRGPFAVLALDVDGLKRVNDTLGHDVGDAMLTTVAHAVQEVMRRGDVLARLGGDEFAAHLFDAGEDDARHAATRMLAALASATAHPGVSIGIACGDLDDDPHHVHVAADAAMYRAKRAGGRRLELAPAPAPAPCPPDPDRVGRRP